MTEGGSNRKGIINIFVRAIYLLDNKMIIILKGGGKPIEIDDILLDEIEQNNAEFECSSLVADSPPRRRNLYVACDDAFL